MIPKELTADTNFDEEELHLRRLELRRESIYSQLMAVAQRTSMERRSWICLSEIADACARAPGQPEVDGARRALMIEWLRESVLQGEFEDPQTSSRHAQSRLAFLHTSPHANLRFEREWAENTDKWKAWTAFSPTEWNSWSPPAQWPVTIWMRRDDCVAWFAKHDIAPPTNWGLDAGDSTPSSATRVASTPKPKRGPKYKYDWGEVELFVEDELNNNGDFERPEFAGDGWRSQADLEKRVLEHIKKFEGKEPAPSTVRSHVGRMVAAWRAKGRR
jgi:hypothetical protein